TNPLNGRTPENIGTNESLAGYAQVEAHLHNGLSVFGGARYTQDNRKAGTGVVQNGVCNIPGLPLDDCYKRNQAKFNYWSWTVGARYQFTDDLQVYGRVARG